MAKQKPGLLARVRASWRVLFGGYGNPQSVSDLVPDGSNTAGQVVTDNTVLSLSAAWACTRLISETIATLPLHIYERTSTGRRLATNHSMYNMLRNKPNVHSSASTLWESVTASMVLRGNGFVEKRKLGKRTVALYYLERSRLRALGKDGKQFEYWDYDGSRRVIHIDDIFHAPGFSLDGRWGVSAIRYGAAIFGAALAAATAANSIFKDGLMPKVFFSLDKVLKKEQRQDFRDSLEDVRGAINAGESPLLEGGMKAEVLAINPKDAQLLEVRQFSVEEVCRWFRVDPSMVGHGGKDSNWGTGLEQKLIAFLTFTLRPWIKKLEDAINNRLLPAEDQGRYFVEFSIEGLLRADSKARAEFYKIMIDHGIFTRDEVRELENMPPQGGNAAKLTVNSATTVLDALASAQQTG